MVTIRRIYKEGFHILIMSNERQNRINELEKIVPVDIQNKIESSLGSLSAFYAGAVLGASSFAGASYLVFNNLPHDSAPQVYAAMGFFGLLGAGFGGILGMLENTRMKVKKAGIRNPEIMDEFWEWAELNDYTK